MSRQPDPAYLKIAMAVGERVKAARTAFQMTQKELAQRLSISQSYLSEVENGKGKANIDLLVGLAIYFPDLNPEWLLTGRGPMQFSGDVSSRKDPYNLDIDAVWFSQKLFWDSLAQSAGDQRNILIQSQHYIFNLYYRTYMSHFDALLAQGLPEQEAREMARAECLRVSEERDTSTY
jgi:transcriptional regulator with XRE-family HTH domain